MSLLFTDESSNALVTVLTDAINYGDSQIRPYVGIYSGTRPCDTSSINSDNILLATIMLNEVPFAEPVNGIAVANESTPQSDIPTGGVATWFRIFNRNEEAILDGDITGPAGRTLPSCSSGPSRGLIDGDLIFDFPQVFKGNLIGLDILAVTTPMIN
jgi:hypothetical protein